MQKNAYFSIFVDIEKSRHSTVFQYNTRHQPGQQSPPKYQKTKNKVFKSHQIQTFEFGGYKNKSPANQWFAGDL